MPHTIGTIQSRASGTANPLTASVTVAQGETILVVMLKVNGGTDRTGGSLTRGSQTFTQADSTRKAAASPEASAEVWYLLNPDVGTADVSIPNAGGLTIFHQIAAAKAPAGGASVFSAAWGNNGTSTNPTCGSAALPSAGNIIFANVAGGHQDITGISAQTGSIICEVDDGAHGQACQYLIQNTPVPGGQAMSWTHGTSDDWGAVAVAFCERPANTLNNYMSVSVGDGMVTGDRIR